MNQILQWLVGVETGDLARSESWRLGFVAGYNNYISLGLIVVFLLLVGLTIRSYRREGDTPKRTKGILAGIRIAIFLLVLLIAFQPAVIWTVTKTLYSAVVVVVDDSKSMSFTDRYADDPEMRSALLEKLGVDQAELEQMSRSEIARRVLTSPDGPLAKLAKDHPLVMLHFSTTQAGKESYTRPMGNEIDVVAEDDADPQTGELVAKLEAAMKTLSADGFETNLPAALRDAVERNAGRRLAGVVLVTDGQNTTQDAATRLPGALALADRVGAPRYGVLVGDTTEPRNVTLSGLQAPREVRRDSRVELTAMLSHRNLAGKGVTVEIFRRKEGEKEDKNTPVTTKKVMLRSETKADGSESDRGVEQVQMYIKPDVEGTFVYTARVKADVEEENLDDNESEALVKVSDSKIRVLLISGYAGWEFQYLRNFLVRSPDLYRVSIWQQNADPQINQSASSEELRLERLPNTLKELMGSTNPEEKAKFPGYDVVILNDPRPEAEGFDPNFVANLKTFVTKHDGGLCYLAGPKWTERVLGDKLFEPLADMLPVYIGKSTSEMVAAIRDQKPEPWPVGVTEYGMEHSVMRLGGSIEESKELWKVMPGIFWSKTVFDTKPACRVLAGSSDPTRRTSTKEPEPIIAVQPMGGRVLYLGFQATWRWRYLDDARYYRQFWRNCVRYLATLKARHIVITTGGDRFSAGQRMTVDVEAHDESYTPLVTEDGTFPVDMVNTKTGDVRELTLKAVENQPGRYKADIVVSKTGTYELTALRDDPLADEKVATKRITVELPKAEAARTEANKANLLTIASRDGYYMNIAQADRLAERIPSGKMKAIDPVARQLWDSPLTLILILSLLVAEWILRKKHNMA
ncbi:MAG: hypothetical protein ACLFVH_01705 [Phycisphaerae bacterium]